MPLLIVANQYIELIQKDRGVTGLGTVDHQIEQIVLEERIGGIDFQSVSACPGPVRTLYWLDREDRSALIKNVVARRCSIGGVVIAGRPTTDVDFPPEVTFFLLMILPKIRQLVQRGPEKVNEHRISIREGSILAEKTSKCAINDIFRVYPRPQRRFEIILNERQQLTGEIVVNPARRLRANRRIGALKLFTPLGNGIRRIVHVHSLHALAKWGRDRAPRSKLELYPNSLGQM